MKQLHSVDDLSRVLGKRFTILAGSAVSFQSQGPSRFLPSVGDVTSEWFHHAAASLRDPLDPSSYYDRILAKYASELADGIYSILRSETKFEDFLWRLLVAHGADQPVVDLLRSLFLCERDQCNANHAAIGTLLSVGRSCAALTTNFDNGIEIADPSIPTIVHPNHPPTLDSGPALLKLHGDVITGGLVATSPALLKGHELDSFRYVGALLRGRRVLVVGYSGTGDVDISPHLKSSGAVFVWVTSNRSGSQPPGYSRYWIRSNLESSDPSENCLIGLVSTHGSAPLGGQGRPDWEGRLEEWFAKAQSDALRQCIRSMFNGETGWRGGWPIAHLHQVQVLNNVGGFMAPWERTWQLARSAIGISAYRTARAAISEISSAGEKHLGAKLIVMKGFVDWRLGRLEEAIRTLQPIALNPGSGAMKEWEWQGARVYLEVAQDILRNKRSVDSRKTISDQLSLEVPRARLRTASIDNFADNSLSQTVEVSISLLLGEVDRPTATNELKQIYQAAYSVQSWNAAHEASQVLVSIAWKDGVRGMISVNRILIRQGHMKRAWKALGAASRCRAIQRLIDGDLGAPLLANLSEFLYRGSARRWTRRFNKGIVEIERNLAFFRWVSALWESFLLRIAP